MGHAELAQVLAHGDACLAGTDNKRVDFHLINHHARVLLKGGLVQVGHGCLL
ncbi:hypothetical protein D3C73_1636940 [compost metagenome]